MPNLVYSLKSQRLEKRHLTTDYQAGDVYIFKSGTAQVCTRCHNMIPSMTEQVIQRRATDAVPGYGSISFNDRYHMSCMPSWLVDPVAMLMERV